MFNDLQEDINILETLDFIRHKTKLKKKLSNYLFIFNIYFYFTFYKLYSVTTEYRAVALALVEALDRVFQCLQHLHTL